MEVGEVKCIHKAGGVPGNYRDRGNIILGTPSVNKFHCSS